jgi:hypothetical protein
MSDETTENKTKPKPNGDSDRNNKGQFNKGNKAAVGHRNPNARKTQELHNALLKNIKPSDIRAIVKKLIDNAKAGDIVAAREVLDRCLGKPEKTIVSRDESETRIIRWALEPPNKK